MGPAAAAWGPARRCSCCSGSSGVPSGGLQPSCRMPGAAMHPSQPRCGQGGSRSSSSDGSIARRAARRPSSPPPPPLTPAACRCPAPCLPQVVAAYLLAALGGNAAPAEADIKKILSSGALEGQPASQPGMLPLGTAPSLMPACLEASVVAELMPMASARQSAGAVRQAWRAQPPVGGCANMASVERHSLRRPAGDSSQLTAAAPVAPAAAVLSATSLPLPCRCRCFCQLPFPPVIFCLQSALRLRPSACRSCWPSWRARTSTRCAEAAFTFFMLLLLLN